MILLEQKGISLTLDDQNVDRENSNKIKQEEGALAVARVKAQARNVSDFTIPFLSFHLMIDITSRRKQTRRPTA